MPGWVKWFGWLALILLLAGFAVVALAVTPPINQSLAETGAWLAAGGIICGYIFLRMAWRWETWKLRAGAWYAGRKEERERLGERNRKRERE